MGTASDFSVPGSSDRSPHAQQLHDSMLKTAVPASQAVPVSQTASAADPSPSDHKTDAEGPSASPSFVVQAVQQTSSSERVITHGAAEQSTSIRSEPGTAAQQPSTSNLTGWTGFVDDPQQATAPGIGDTAAGAGKRSFKFSLLKAARSRGAKGQSAKQSGIQDHTETVCVPSTASASCDHPETAQTAFSSEDAVPGSSSGSFAQQAPGMLAASTTSTASLSMPASAAHYAEASPAAASAEQNNAADSLDTLLGAIYELEGDSATDSSAAGALAAMGNAPATDQTPANGSQQTGKACLMLLLFRD